MKGKNPHVGHTSDLPEEARVKVEALFRPARDTFELLLQALARFPDPRIRTLSELTWNLVGAQIVPTVLATDAKTISFLSRFSGVNFALLGDKQVEPVETFPVLFIHPALHEMTKKDPSMQAGAIVFGASQAADVWSGKFPPSSKEDLAKAVAAATTRSQIYEAQYLVGLGKLELSWKPNRWQRETLDRWPAGWDSPGAEVHWSEPKAWGS